jgi:multidrug efflux pump subunit AcrA (membrane-fusion protein)
MRSARLVVTLLSLLLAGCGSVGGTPTPLPTVVLDLGGEPNLGPAEPLGGATASGFVSSPAEAHLAFGQGGVVVQVHVDVGDSVRAGDVLVEQDATLAQLELDQAERTLRELTSPAAIAAADQAVALAQQEQDKAQKKVVALSYPRATEAFIDNLSAQITLARRELAAATREFNHVEDRASNDPERANAQVRMTDAQIDLNKLVGNYNWYTGQPSEIDVALTYANLEAANAAVQQAEWYAAALRGETLPPEASGAKLAGLQQAEDAVAAARARLESTRLTSPIDGVVGAIDIQSGEYAAPGVPLAVVTDLDNLRVETTDLSELDLPGVAVDQPATVDVEALGLQVPGRVAAVSPVAETLGGDVVYRVVVALDEIPEGLRPGMTVEVTFGRLP